jgi:HSP20 family protein
VIFLEWRDYNDWLKRRQRRISYLTKGFSEDIEEMMAEMFREIQGDMPRDLIREEKLPDGSTIKKFGPMIYGYSISVDSDGKQVIRKFGNVRPTNAQTLGTPRRRGVKTEREPLVDVIEEDSSIKVIVEVPGVKKEDIKLNSTKNSITISVECKERQYYRKIDLPTEIDPERAKTSYRNGVLEVILSRKQIKPKSNRINID